MKESAIDKLRFWCGLCPAIMEIIDQDLCERTSVINYLECRWLSLCPFPVSAYSHFESIARIYVTIPRRKQQIPTTWFVTKALSYLIYCSFFSDNYISLYCSWHCLEGISSIESICTVNPDHYHFLTGSSVCTRCKGGTTSDIDNQPSLLRWRDQLIPYY